MLGAHPYANLFPLMEGEEFTRLIEDIRVNGLIHPIVRYNNEILDGRNRYRACEIAQRGLRFTDYTGDDPLGYVLAANLNRRHLTESQRAMVASKLATMKRGQTGKSQRMRSANLPISQPEAAKVLKTSERSMRSAAKVRALGTPDLVSAVERGEIKVSTAARLAQLPPEAQVDAVHRQERIPFILKAAPSPSPERNTLKALRRAWFAATPQERALFLAEITGRAATAT